MGFPTDYFPVLFAIPRVAGWLAHWVELMKDPEFRIARPRQWYTGESERPFVGIPDRPDVHPDVNTRLASYSSMFSTRRSLSPSFYPNRANLSLHVD